MKYKLDFLHLNLKNLGQLSQDFQKVLIFEYCKNDNAIGGVNGFNFSYACTHRIDCITKTMSKLMFIKVIKL